mmetsp:Transcript_24381/g.40728  ORF Transcript_24381/g.40728 Transcript_24381/m.40728 type:complete len:82 (+) Transcript_24381:1301-1546(+)
MCLNLYSIWHCIKSAAPLGDSVVTFFGTCQPSTISSSTKSSREGLLSPSLSFPANNWLKLRLLSSRFRLAPRCELMAEENE